MSDVICQVSNLCGKIDGMKKIYANHEVMLKSSIPNSRVDCSHCIVKLDANMPDTLTKSRVRTWLHGPWLGLGTPTVVSVRHYEQLASGRDCFNARNYADWNENLWLAIANYWTEPEIWLLMKSNGSKANDVWFDNRWVNVTTTFDSLQFASTRSFKDWEENDLWSQQWSK